MSLPPKANAAEAQPRRSRIRLMGMPLDVMGERELLEAIFAALDRGAGGWVVTPNLDHLRRFVSDAGARAPYEQADVVVADGMPLVWASRLQGTPLPERVAGSSLIYPLAERAARSGRSVYLLGGAPGDAERAAGVLRARAPELRIAGIDSPEPGFEQDPVRFEEVRRRVLSAAPDLVLVCLGSPKQEHVIERLRPDLPLAWFMGLGVTLSFVAGTIPRAPDWVQRAGSNGATA
jgi:N-acetylglucosaminyldiphosphoundecaprenol N-acetyl-beta-D-mannosaminyltransferase